MFKRIMVVVISILAMILVAMLLTRIWQSDADPGNQPSFLKVEAPQGTDASPAHIGVRDPSTGIAKGLFVIVRRDKDGRLVQSIHANMMPVGNTGRAKLSNVEIVNYNKDGEQLLITAPEGFIDTEGSVVMKVEDIKRGALSGGVTLRQDRGQPDRPESHIVFTTDHIDFDQKTFQLYTDDPVKVRSPEGDIDADGLQIYLVPGRSQEIRELVFRKNVRITIRQDSDKLSLGLGDMATNAPTTGPSAASASASAAGRGSAATAGGSTAAKSGSAAKPGPAAAAASAAGSAKAGERRMYHFTLNDTVHVAQDQVTLDAATLHVFMFLKGQGKSGPGAAKPAATAARPDGATVARDPAGSSAAVARSAAAPAGQVSARTAADAGSGSGPAADSNAKKSSPVAITCKGPLVILPVAELYQGYHITAVDEKKEVVIVDRDLRATCNYLDYDAGTRAVTLRGKELSRTGGAPLFSNVTVRQGTNTLVGPEVNFEQTGPGQFAARITGQGSMSSESTGGLSLGGELRPGAAAKEPFTASWSKAMRVVFMNREKPAGRAGGAAAQGGSTAEGGSAGGGSAREGGALVGEKGSSRALVSAEFLGDAVLRQGEQSLSANHLLVNFFAPQPDYAKDAISRVEAGGHVAVSQPPSKEPNSRQFGNLTCDHLVFDFEAVPRAGSRPLRMRATGGVHGTSASDEIVTEDMTVGFKETVNKVTGAVKSEPTSLAASRGVTLRRGELFLEASSLSTPEGNAPAEVIGTAERWATVINGKSKLRGQRITVDPGPPAGDGGTGKSARGAPTVRVTGPGTLDHFSQTAKGEALPLHVDWTRSMVYDGQATSAHFSGDTKTRLPNAAIDCQDLWLFFAAAEETAAEKSPRKDAKGDSPMDDLLRSQGLTPVRLTAVKDVVARSLTTPAAPEKAISVSEMRCPDKLEYDVLKKIARVPGAGRLDIFEVARVPASVAAEKRTPINSTRVVWEGDMGFSRGDLQAWFRKNVVTRITGFSSAKLQSFMPETQADSATARNRPADTGAGSKLDTTLKCQDLRLYFSQAQADQAARPASDQVSEAGDLFSAGSGVALDRLVAYTEVSMQDNEFYAQAPSQIAYDENKGLVVLSGTAASPAVIWQQNNKKEQLNKLIGERIRYWRATGKTEITGNQEIELTPPGRK